MRSSINQNLIYDDVEYLQVGNGDAIPFFDMQFTELDLSYEDFYPKNYKFAGMSIYSNLNLKETHRRTYDLLNFLGDVGGLDGVFVIVGPLILGWFQNRSFNKYVLEKLYDERKQKRQEI
jgi:hypothetical protein